MTHYRLPLALATSLLFSVAASADPQCTDAPADQWMNKDAFKKKLEADGYAIKNFKVTDTNCYEIYAKDSDGKKVEIYFNPVDGTVVDEDKED